MQALNGNFKNFINYETISLRRNRLFIFAIGSENSLRLKRCSSASEHQDSWLTLKKVRFNEHSTSTLCRLNCEVVSRLIYYSLLH